ncbi:MAG TPA: hypothetical protein VEL11_15535 [Candidatus Bathyarchaeia archaeon]|nr:hypothetical protein [Candidatus Bathyarchaeia archaeon]
MKSEEVQQRITNYGYLLVGNPKKYSPSYYKVKDETIIGASIRIETVLENPRSGSHAIRTSNNIKAYVPNELRKPDLYKPFQPNEIVTGIIDASEYNDYELSNGVVISIRTIVNQIKKTRYFTKEGEPIYSVIITPVIKTKAKKSG